MRRHQAPPHNLLIAGLAASVAMLAAFFLCVAAPAAAEPQTATSGTLTWGVKESFRSYVTGPIANGSISTEGGVSTTASGAFSFPATSGSYDSTADTSSAAFAGSVQFSGHAGALELAITDVKVELNGSTGALIADVTSKSLQSGVVETYADTAIANLDLSAVTPSTSANGVEWLNIPAVLSEAGAPAFAGFYTAGAEMDPVSMSLSFGAEATATPAATGTPDATGAPAVTPTPVAAPVSPPKAGGQPLSEGDGTPLVVVLAATLLLASAGSVAFAARKHQA